MNLTENEIIALKTCLNYDNRESQLSDNYSNGGQKEFMKVLKWNHNQVSALIGSLEKKGLIDSDDNEQGNGDNICWLTEKGVNVIFDIIEKES